MEDYEIVKNTLDYLSIYDFERKRPPPKIDNTPDVFDDDYIKLADGLVHCCSCNYKN